MVNPVDKTGNARPVNERVRSSHGVDRGTARGSVHTGSSGQADQATVSSRGVLANRLVDAARNASGVDPSHVQAVRQQLQKGDYHVPGKTLARALMLAEWILRNGGR